LGEGLRVGRLNPMSQENESDKQYPDESIFHIPQV
jgi:hypothetical protein